MTVHDVLNDVFPHQVDIELTDEIKAKTTAHGNLIDLFAIGSRSHEVNILRCFVIPANRYYTFSYALIRRTECKKFIHSMNDKD